MNELLISLKDDHFPKNIILYAVFFYVRYGVSYRDLEEMMEELGAKVDLATLNRWFIDYSPFIKAEAKKHKHTVAASWRIDETRVKVKCQRVCLYLKKITNPMMGVKALLFSTDNYQ